MKGTKPRGIVGGKESKRGVFPPGPPFVLTRDGSSPRARTRRSRAFAFPATAAVSVAARFSSSATASAGPTTRVTRTPGGVLTVSATRPSPRGPPRRRGDVLGEGRAVVLDDERAAVALRARGPPRAASRPPAMTSTETPTRASCVSERGRRSSAKGAGPEALFFNREP